MTLGDFVPGSVLDFKFTTVRPSSGAPFTLAGTPALSVYKDNSTTQSTTGITLTADFDAVTGLNHCRIDTSADGAFYSAGSHFDVVITTGTVDSVSAVGFVVGRFTLSKASALRPTTAGRTLDVSAGGEAGLDWANIGSPTTTVNLSGTTILTATSVETDTADIQARLPAALVSGRIDASVGAMAANVLTATAIAADAITAAKVAADVTTEIQSGLATAAALATVDGVVDAILVDTNELQTDWANGGRLDNILDAAGGAGDPWATALPGAYSAGTAGNIIGNRIDAAITSRLATAGYTAPLDAAGVRSAVGLASANLDTQLSTIDTVADGIKAKTDSLAFTVAGQVDANIQYVNDVAVTGTGALGDEWGP